MFINTRANTSRASLAKAGPYNITNAIFTYSLQSGYLKNVGSVAKDGSFDTTVSVKQLGVDLKKTGPGTNVVKFFPAARPSQI